MADMNAQQIASLQEKTTRAVQHAIEQMNLRKYAIEQAASLWSTLPSPLYGFDKDTQATKKLDDVAYSPVELAQHIYNFVTAPAQNITIKIEQ